MAIQFPSFLYRDPVQGIQALARSITGMLRDEEQPERWNVLFHPAADMHFASVLTDPAEYFTSETALAFSAGSSRYSVGLFRLPHGYKFASQVVPRLNVYLISAPASTASSTSMWIFYYRWYNVGAVQSASFNAITVAFQHTSTLRQMQTIDFGSISMSVTSTLGSFLKFTLQRAGAHAGDNLDPFVVVDGVSLYYKLDVNRGSETEDKKWSGLP